MDARSTRRGLLLVASVVGCWAAFAAPAGAAPPSGISGHVTDQSNGDPVAGACVAAFLPGSPVPTGFSALATVDGSGDYFLDLPTANDYEVVFSSPSGPCGSGPISLQTEWYDNHLTRSNLELVTVDGVNTTPNVNAQVVVNPPPPAPSGISGTVLKTNGQPASGVCVAAFDPNDSSVPGGVRGTASVGPGGGYFLPVSAGDYKVRFTNPQPGCPGGPPIAITPQWYDATNDGTTMFGDAAIVHVNAGGTTPNINATVEAINGAPTCPSDVNAAGPMNAPISVFASCSDPNFEQLTYVVDDDGVHGDASATQFGLGYQPDSDFTGTDTFTARAFDGQAHSNQFTVHVSVQDPAVNQPPTCPETNVWVEMNSSIKLTGNCVDPEDDPIFYGPADPFTVNGSFTNPTGDSVVFHPTPNYTGPAALNYTVRDPYHPPAQFHIPIDVLPINTPCCESAPEATPEEPYAASITSPVPGGIYIDTRPTSVDAPPPGFTVLDREYDMHAPDAIDRADPLVFVFKIDGAELAAQNVDPADVQLLRNRVSIHATCPTPADRPADDSWWPCEESRDDVADHNGDLWITVLTMKASIWNVGVPAVADTDADDDGVDDDVDNCPAVANENQDDADDDGIGDVCDSDRDGDGADNDVDNCADVSNPGQANLDGDALGDACDPDRDGDNVANGSDNCADVSNTGQANLDGDALGDACDPDRDGDNVANGSDNCVNAANTNQLDADHDGIGAACDTKEQPTSKADCKNNGWKAFNGDYKFKNEGDCVSHIATGGKNKPNGRRRHRNR